MTKKHLRQYSGTAVKLRINELPARDVLRLQFAADFGRPSRAIDQEFRELIEAKSRFIPKIFGDIE